MIIWSLCQVRELFIVSKSRTLMTRPVPLQVLQVAVNGRIVTWSISWRILINHKDFEHCSIIRQKGRWTVNTKVKPHMVRSPSEIWMYLLSQFLDKLDILLAWNSMDSPYHLNENEDNTVLKLRSWCVIKLWLSKRKCWDKTHFVNEYNNSH